MMWVDIASIVFACVTMNHLGLISAIEDVTHRKLWIVNCPKCSTFWATMVYCCYDIATYKTAITVLAVSFMASYSAIWLELFEGFIDSLYMKLYEKIYPNPYDDTLTAEDFDDNYSTGTVSEL